MGGFESVHSSETTGAGNACVGECLVLGVGKIRASHMFGGWKV